jgi:hypothetical protein
VWIIAGRHEDKPEQVPKGTSEFKKGYIAGYLDATRSKKKQNALVGTVLGTIVMAGIITIALVSGAFSDLPGPG